jgi:hypothetical protein
MAHRAFDDLRAWAETQYRDLPDCEHRSKALAERVAAIPSHAVQPPPLVTGDDLAERGVAPGPIYKQVLDTLYTLQLDELITTREQSLSRLDELLANAKSGSPRPDGTP